MPFISIPFVVLISSSSLRATREGGRGRRRHHHSCITDERVWSSQPTQRASEAGPPPELGHPRLSIQPDQQIGFGGEGQSSVNGAGNPGAPAKRSKARSGVSGPPYKQTWMVAPRMGEMINPLSSSQKRASGLALHTDSRAIITVIVSISFSLCKTLIATDRVSKWEWDWVGPIGTNIRSSRSLQ